MAGGAEEETALAPGLQRSGRDADHSSPSELEGTWVRERGLAPAQDLESEKASGYQQGTARNDILEGD